jgi:protein-arginine kinase activator protein McsA
MKCDNCGGERFSLVASRINGKDKLIDVYLCMSCQHSKQVIIETNKEESYPIDVPIPDLDNDGDFEHEDWVERDSFEDNDGGWDPSIG